MHLEICFNKILLPIKKNPVEAHVIDGFGNHNLEVGGVEGSGFVNKSILNLYFLHGSLHPWLWLDQTLSTILVRMHFCRASVTYLIFANKRVYKIQGSINSLLAN